MAYVVVKTINGRRYRYLQRSFRVPGRRTPKTESKCLGPMDGGYDAKRERALRAADKATEKLEAEQRRDFGGTAQELQDRAFKAGMDKLHTDYGLTMPSSDLAPQQDQP